LLIGISQGFLVGLVTLFSKFFRSKANQYFSYTILLISLICFINVYIFVVGENGLIIFLNDIMLEYLFPVTFLFYFAFSIQDPIAKSRLRYWLFLPFIIAATINIIIDLDMDFGLIDFGLEEGNEAVIEYYFWEYIGTLIFTVAMSLWSFRMIQTYQPKREVAFKKQWFKQFWYFANSLIAFWIINTAIEIGSNTDLLAYLFSGICLLFFCVSYRGIFQFKLAEEQYEIRSILQQMDPDPSNIAVSTKEELPENLHINRFIKLMQEEHLYRDPELNRDSIAAKLGISSGYFSQVFNQYFTENFSEYINELRVNDVKRMLMDEAFQQYSLIAIGFEAGFSSKSSFYAVFKRITGMTPTAFKQKAG
ncbi:MAG: helix-turn-helix domain-containing protein, partial [Bacteroidota bacterium]